MHLDMMFRVLSAVSQYMGGYLRLQTVNWTDVCTLMKILKCKVSPLTQPFNRHNIISLVGAYWIIMGWIIMSARFSLLICLYMSLHDDVIKWKHFSRNWPFVQGIHRAPVNSPHKGQWHGALIFSLICVWINGWVNNGEAGDLRRYCAHYDVTVMDFCDSLPDPSSSGL